MSNLLRTLLMGLMLAVSPDIVGAGPLEDGNAAVERGDYATALRFWRPLAEQGSAEAQCSLGWMYATGLVPGATEAEDLMRAYMWLNLGASNIPGEAGQKAANRRDGVAKRLTPTQVNRAQEMARQCRAKNFKDCD